MTLDEIHQLFRTWVKETDESWNDPMASPESTVPLQAALEAYEAECAHPEPAFYDIATNFYHARGNYRLVEQLLDRWKKVKGNPIIPIIRHALLYFADGYIGYDECLSDIKEGLEQKPDNPFLLSIGYQAAFDENDCGRRLHYAGRMAAISAEAPQHIQYALECGRNLMLDRAQAEFQAAHKLDPNNTRVLNGLGYCCLEKLKLDESEQFFERSLKIEETRIAKEALVTIDRLRRAKAWTDEEKRLQKFWNEWADDQLCKANESEQGRLLAECFTAAGG